MQGVQPSPNNTPSSGAPASPARGRSEGRTIRPANVNRSSTPENSRPSAMVSAPSTCVRPCWCSLSAVPRLPNATPYVVNRAENPSTNSAVPATTLLRRGRAGTSADGAPALTEVPAGWAPAPDMPVTYDRSPATSGRHHGHRKVTAPAAAATGTPRRSGPELTRLPTLMAGLPLAAGAPCGGASPPASGPHTPAHRRPRPLPPPGPYGAPAPPHHPATPAPP